MLSECELIITVKVSAKDGCIWICLDYHQSHLVSGYQSVTNSPETHWNRGTVLFVSSRNKMCPFAQGLEIQRRSGPAKSRKAGELTGSSWIKLHNFKIGDLRTIAGNLDLLPKNRSDVNFKDQGNYS